MPGSDERTAGLAAADMRRLIAEMLDLRMRRAYDRFQNYVDPRVVVYCNAWREGIIGPDVWNGAPALFDLFRRTDENYLPLGYEILDMATDGDRAVVRWRGDWRRHGTRQGLYDRRRPFPALGKWSRGRNARVLRRPLRRDPELRLHAKFREPADPPPGRIEPRGNGAPRPSPCGL